MKWIPYTRARSPILVGESCVRLQEGTRIAYPQDAGIPVWLETDDPDLALAELEREPDRLFVLNSLWLSGSRIAAFRELLPRFAGIVFLPFDPQRRDQPYEERVDRVLGEADRLGIGQDRLILDLIILPEQAEPKLQLYAERARMLNGRGLRTVAGLDNVKHRSSQPSSALRRLASVLEEETTYALKDETD